MAKILSYDECLQAMRFLGFQVGTKDDPQSVNERASATARELVAKSVCESPLLPSQIATAWANQPKLTADR